MKKERILADLQSKIWFLFDEKRFDELGSVASKLFSVLDFTRKKSIVAGKLVMNAHLFYEKACEEDKRGNIEKKEYYFKKILEEQIKIRMLLGEDVRAAYYENKWWRYFQHKNYLGVFPYILLQEIIKYRGLNPLIPLLSVFYLIKAGFAGHNERKRDVTAKYLEKYWEITLKHMKDKVQY